MASPKEPNAAVASQDEFVIRRGKRGKAGTRALLFTAILVVAIIALVVAISQPSHFGNGGGGVGTIVIPLFGAVGSAIALFVYVTQWWEDECWCSVAGNSLILRQGTHAMRGRATHFDRTSPVTLLTEQGASEHRVFVEQGENRVVVGDAAEIGALQLTNFAAWLRAAGVIVDRQAH